MSRVLSAAAVALILSVGLSPGLAYAWGDVGHQVIGLIAYPRLTPAVRAKVDAMLAADADALTSLDFASRTTWADKYRNGHRETSEWHFVDIEIDHPDLTEACFGFPALGSAQPASQGPAKDCVVNKIAEFSSELRNPSTPPAERLLALKFLMHFVGDLHQPLHAADHNDRGGNCVTLESSADVRSTNLHAYWDTGALQPWGSTPADIAMRLDREIKPAQAEAWSRGDAKAWAQDSFALAKSAVYALPRLPTCDDKTPVALSPAYQVTAQKAVAGQLERAGVRLAWVLNEALR